MGVYSPSSDHYAAPCYHHDHAITCARAAGRCSRVDRAPRRRPRAAPWSGCLAGGRSRASPSPNPSPTQVIPSWTGRRLSRAFPAWTFLAAVSTYNLKEAAENLTLTNRNPTNPNPNNLTLTT